MEPIILNSLYDIRENPLLNKRKDLLRDNCYHCEREFQPGDPKVIFENGNWHKDCFLCAQCLQPLEVDLVFKNSNRMYCLHDYKMLFAPSCIKCNNFILEGRIIKAIDANWHSNCFTCVLCDVALADCSKFKKKNNSPYCSDCYDRTREEGFMCAKCKSLIPDNAYIKQDDQYFHLYHFRCVNCWNELSHPNYRRHTEDGELYCLRCYDTIFDIPICNFCKRPVEQSRIIRALGKTFHSEHFVCSFCDKPFLGSRYFQLNGAVYCQTHYQLMLDNDENRCCYCLRDTTGGCVEFLGCKKYCVNHFRCFGCDQLLDVQGGKLYKFDRKPICKLCLQRLPGHLRKRLAALHKAEYEVSKQQQQQLQNNSKKNSFK